MIVLLLLNVLIFLCSVALGNRDIPFLDAWATALGWGNDTYAFTIRQLRLPRIWTGFLAGCGLALSGAVLQVVTRNPLASPGVIGINSGAAAAVVSVLVLVPSFPIRQLPVVAFVGALAAVAVIYGLAWRKGGTMERMLLAGVAISAMAGAWITYLLTVGRSFESRKLTSGWPGACTRGPGIMYGRFCPGWPYYSLWCCYMRGGLICSSLMTFPHQASG